jgi:protein-L-isoaspartate(D-aspartate) O-methyltransferase
MKAIGLGTLALAIALPSGPADFKPQRERMVQAHIQARGIRHKGVLDAMRNTPRHLFVPEEIRGRAYDDTPLPIGHGQTISQPYIVASMSELLRPQPSDRVLEIGCGSGYQAAILSPLVKHVYTMEIVEPLARQSEQLLRQLGYKNITVRLGDGYEGWPEEAPFDKIIITAAPPEMPEALIRQLKNGGRLVAPIGREWQELVVLDKDERGRVTQRREYPVMFVPMVPRRK